MILSAMREIEPYHSLSTVQYATVQTGTNLLNEQDCYVVAIAKDCDEQQVMETLAKNYDFTEQERLGVRWGVTFWFVSKSDAPVQAAAQAEQVIGATQ